MTISVPVSDGFSSGTVTPTPASPATFFDKIDEIVADDTDYINIQNSPFVVDGSAFVNLASITDPGVDTGHVLNVRYRGGSGGSGLVPLTVQLLQGVTLIAQVDFAQTLNFTNASYTLSAAEASSITDYTILQMSLNVSAGGGFFDSIDVSLANLAVPTAPFYDVFLWARPDE